MWTQKYFSTLSKSKLLNKLENPSTKYTYTNNEINITVSINDKDSFVAERQSVYKIPPTNMMINSKINPLFGKFVQTKYGMVCQIINKMGQFFTGIINEPFNIIRLIDNSKLEIIEHVDFNETFIKIVVNNNNQKINIMTLSDNMGLKNKSYDTFMKWYNKINNNMEEEVIIKPKVVKEITYDMMDMIFDMNLECINKC
jgi:hypothetical protein